MPTVRLTYEEGTIRVEGVETAGETLASVDGIEYDSRTECYRAPAFRYVDIREILVGAEATIVDEGLDVSALSLESSYRLREYQQDALEAWEGANSCGVLELPTGSGKTVIGLGAIEACDTPTLVVVPTIDLLTQWQHELESEFAVPIGRLGGGKQRVEDITVATYDSAHLRADELGDRFGLVIFDEVHHLGGKSYRDIARLFVAPARLGLTATFERPDGEHTIIEEVLGPLVYRATVDELSGEHLAPYDIKRIEVSLTPEERDMYERHQTVFTEYLASSNITLRSGSDYQELVKRSGTDPRAREALLAKQQAREVMMNAERKVKRLADILDRHTDDRVIIFTAHTDLVYQLSERFLIPAITHETTAGERRDILKRFREGEYTRVVTANVLDEGVDVPDANVAVVLSGSGSEREFTQRLGRILRPNADGERALLYELVTEETAEEQVARRRR
ncbi:DEAD/DEAH box helicase [Halovenus rubra]|uniref:DEAD/DEAH box helicase n=2 Tax=Halovenus rubra TaxID=869890 RepID=A0ACC7E1K1_9EURY